MTGQASPLTGAMDRKTADDAVALHVVHNATIDLARARAAFADLTWLGPVSFDATTDGWRRAEADLELPVLDGSGPAVRKAAIVGVGEIREAGGGLHVPIAWSSASFTPLFPVFAGELEIRRSSLELTGRYAPPFGRVGVLIDRALLHFIATRSATALLTTVARRCQG